MKIELNGKWEFKCADDAQFLPATVPGCNYLDLMENGQIADPFYGTNEKDLYWVSEKDWIYKRTFNVTEEALQYRHIHLICNCVDTLATIKLNGKVVKECNNQHLCHDINVNDYLELGQNDIEIYFYSPVKYILDKQGKEKCPPNNNGLDGVAHIRKTQCHFGWDWGPVLTPSGISGDIFILAYNSRILSFKQSQNHHANGSVDVDISYNIAHFKDGQKVRVSLISPSGKLEGEQMATNKSCVSFCVADPVLWWTKEFSHKAKQDLYTVKIELLKDDKVIDILEKQIGLRTMVLDRSKDKYGENFAFKLNGHTVFAKGASWIPSDSFVTRTTPLQLEQYIKLAQNSNFNMIRVWGGGYYESDTFYDLCDKYGLLVWQDFTFACQAYPFFMEDFLQNAKADIEQNIIRLRHHASLALWCGNNEIELMSPAWMTRKKYIDWTEKFFYNILPDFVKAIDDTTPFISGTPIGTSHNKNVTSDKYGNTHMWAVWHGLQGFKYYRTRLTRFCSEFGFESLPDIKTIESFATEKDYDLDSEVFNAHQKCLSGNKKIKYYISTRFRLPLDFKDYIYLSNICQSECIKDATEHWRRNKGRCNGSLYWQFNDCWPTCSWSSVDYYGRYKALQYTAKKFFKPLMVSIEDSKKRVKIFAHNDALIPETCTVEVTLASFTGCVHYRKAKDFCISENCNMEVDDIDLTTFSRTQLKNSYLSAKLFVEGKEVSLKTIIFGKEKNLKFPQTDINMEIHVIGNIANYTLKSDSYQRYVCLSNNIDAPFSDNYFDLLPNEPYTVTQNLTQSNPNTTKESNTQTIQTEPQTPNPIPTKQDLTATTKVKTITKITPQSTKFHDFITRQKIFFIPINLANWFYYKFLL